jgi:SPP1 gp7 family putative phage head morphogenesis protein
LTAQDYQARYIKEHGGEIITNMSRTDQKRLTQFIWSNANEHERPLAKAIDKQPNLRYILDRGNHRTETIIRTEKARATRYGAMNYASDWGAKTKTWHTAGDHRVRPSHRALGGSEIPIGEEFPHEGMFPGEQSINCRCFLTYGF